MRGERNGNPEPEFIADKRIVLCIMRAKQNRFIVAISTQIQSCTKYLLAGKVELAAPFIDYPVRIPTLYSSYMV